jgi:hypothetical protein
MSNNIIPMWQGNGCCCQAMRRAIIAYCNKAMGIPSPGDEVLHHPPCREIAPRQEWGGRCLWMRRMRDKNTNSTIILGGYFAQCRAILPAEIAGSANMYVRGRIALGFPAIFKPFLFYSTSEQNVRTTAHLCIQQASFPDSCHPLSRVYPSSPYRLGMRRPLPSHTPGPAGPAKGTEDVPLRDGRHIPE